MSKRGKPKPHARNRTWLRWSDPMGRPYQDKYERGGHNPIGSHGRNIARFDKRKSLIKKMGIVSHD